MVLKRPGYRVPDEESYMCSNKEVHEKGFLYCILGGQELCKATRAQTVLSEASDGRVEL